jgi:uncharacterized protein (DUF1919 family)
MNFNFSDETYSIDTALTMTMTHVHAQRDMPNDIQNQNTSGALSVYTGLHLFLRSPFLNLFFFAQCQIDVEILSFFLSQWLVEWLYSHPRHTTL